MTPGTGPHTPTPLDDLPDWEDATAAFVIGRGRSGTWLLQSILNRHPSVDLAPEGEIVMLLKGRYGAEVRWDEATRRRFCRDLRRIRRLTRWWNLDLDRVERFIVDRGPGSTFGHMCRILYAFHAAGRGRPGARVLGEKNPPYALMVPAVLGALPGARFVHLVRDPRDNVLSFRGVRFDLDSVAGLARRWLRYNRAVLRARERWPDRVLVERFEDLVADPEERLERICDFLGVGMRAELLSPRAGPGTRVLEWNQRITGPIDAGRTARWEEEMSVTDRETVESICGELMEHFGYERRHPRPSAGTRLRASPGALVGELSIGAERLFPHLPFGVQVRLLDRYRSWDETLTGEGADEVGGEKDRADEDAGSVRGEAGRWD